MHATDLPKNEYGAWAATYRYLLVLAAALPELQVPHGSSEAVDAALALLGTPQNPDEAFLFIAELQRIAVEGSVPKG